MRLRFALVLLAIAPLCFAAAAADNAVDWRAIVRDRIHDFGHRNWIVIADAAYPLQTSPGIETIVTNADQIEVVNQVINELSRSRHVTPVVYTDQELKFVPEADASGIGSYRETLDSLLQGHRAMSLPHEEIIKKLDQVSQSFRVLIIKTRLDLPYTSVFLQLDCAYWPSDAETRLRATMSKNK
jgi:hypothetical protein